MAKTLGYKGSKTKVIAAALLSVLSGLAISNFCSSSAAEKSTRKEDLIVRFPTRSMGRFGIRRTDPFKNEQIKGPLQAVGTVRVPPNCAIDLTLNYQGAENSAFLLKLPPEAILWLRSNRLELTDNHIPHIAHLKNLVDLDLEDGELTDEGIKHLAPLAALKRLNLGNNVFTPKSLPILNNKKDLRWLRLSRSNLGDAAGPYVKQLTKLETLDLCGTQATDKTIPYLVPMPNLKELILKRNNITDKALPEICKMKSLEALDLTDTLVTTKGLTKLNKAPKLKILYIRRHKLTHKQLEELDAALPKIKVVEGSKEVEVPRELFAPLR